MMQCCQNSNSSNSSQAKSDAKPVNPHHIYHHLCWQQNGNKKLIKLLLWELLLLIILLVVLDATIVHAAGTQSSCNRTRVVLEDSYGKFSDGEGEYKPATHCQWLIKGGLLCLMKI